MKVPDILGKVDAQLYVGKCTDAVCLFCQSKYDDISAKELLKF